MRSSIAVVFISVALLTACSGEKQKQVPVSENSQQPPSDLPAPAPQIPVVKGISENTLIGKWKVDAVIGPKGDTVKKDNHFEFRADGTFTQDKNKILTNGNWKIINDGADLILSGAGKGDKTFTEILITGNTGTMVSDNKKFFLSRE